MSADPNARFRLGAPAVGALASVALAAAGAVVLLKLRFDPHAASLAALAAAIALAPLIVGLRGTRRSKALQLVAALLVTFAALDGEAGVLFRPHVEVAGGGDFLARDPLLGFGPRPGAHARVHWTLGGRTLYDASYGIGPDGFRLTRSNPAPDADTTVFLGDSYTFGDGLNDADTLSGQYADARQGRERVIDAAFSGYGTHQALRLLQSDRLDHALGAGRRTFIYPMIEEHLERLAGKSPWEWFGTPRYGLDHGGVRYLGPFYPGLDGVVQGLAWRSVLFTMLANQPTREPMTGSTELFGAMAAETRRLAQTRYGGRFIVLLWDEPMLRDAQTPGRARRRAARVDAIAAELARRGVETLRISTLIPDYPRRMAEYVIPVSGHPSAALNRRLALELSRRL